MENTEMENTAMAGQSIDKSIKAIVVCFLGYFLISIPVFILTFNFIHAMMVWNLLLASLPLVFAKLLQKSLEKPKKVKIIVLGLLWLFFFPNAPYMITDFIHISGIEFYSRENLYAPTVYSTNIMSWIKLVHIGLGVFLGTLIGLLSLYIIHQIILASKSKIAANSVVLISCLLSGYAIYIGRFLRLNSWDVLLPVSLLSQLINAINLFSVGFSLLFAGYVLASYCIFYVFFHNKISV